MPECNGQMINTNYLWCCYRFSTTKWVKPNFLTTTKSPHPVSTNAAKLCCVKQNYLGFWFIKCTLVILICVAVRLRWLTWFLHCDATGGKHGSDVWLWMLMERLNFADSSQHFARLAFLDDCISSVLLFGGEKKKQGGYLLCSLSGASTHTLTVSWFLL